MEEKWRAALIPLSAAAVSIAREEKWRVALITFSAAAVGFVLGCKCTRWQTEKELSEAKQIAAQERQAVKDAIARKEEAEAALAKERQAFEEAGTKLRLQESAITLADTIARKEEAEATLQASQAQQRTERSRHEPVAEDGPWHYVWDISDQAEALHNMSSTENIESPKFSLCGKHGLTMRYWPHWDPVSGKACLRLYSPTDMQLSFRLGLGNTGDLFKDVGLDVTNSGQYSSESWFFAQPAADSEESYILWVEIKESESETHEHIAA